MKNRFHSVNLARKLQSSYETIEKMTHFTRGAGGSNVQPWIHSGESFELFCNIVSLPRPLFFLLHWGGKKVWSSEQYGLVITQNSRRENLGVRTTANHTFLNQARAWFLEIAFVKPGVRLVS